MILQVPTSPNKKTGKAGGIWALGTKRVRFLGCIAFPARWAPSTIVIMEVKKTYKWKWLTCFLFLALLVITGYHHDTSGYRWGTVSGWWFQTFFNVLPLLGEDFQFDSYFSDGLKPPTRCDFSQNWWLWVHLLKPEDCGSAREGGSLGPRNLGWNRLDLMDFLGVSPTNGLQAVSYNKPSKNEGKVAYQ